MSTTRGIRRAHLRPLPQLLLAFMALMHASAFGEEASRSDLLGVVKDAKGRPLAAVSVFVDSAFVKRGYSPRCPSCYADCAKKAVSGYDGRFSIEHLDPELRFKILVAAHGFKPRLLALIDPVHAGLAVVLESLDQGKLDPAQIITGWVRDEQGVLVADAVVTPSMFKTTNVDGMMPGVFDPLATTNDEGRFIIAAKEKIIDASFTVSARGFASQIMRNCVPGKPDQTVRLDRGVTIKGRLQADDKPVPDVEVGLVQADRGTGTFYGQTKVATDANGDFIFYNVHGGEDYFVYGIMDTLKTAGAVPALRLKPAAAGTTLDAGTLKVLPAHRLKGKVVLSDHARIPPHTMIQLSRDEAWDTQQVELDAQGSFEFHGLPAECYDLCIRIRDYQLSAQNKTLDRYNADRLMGHVDADIPDLTVLMEPQPEAAKTWPRLDYNEIAKSGWDQNKTKQMRLEGLTLQRDRDIRP